MSLSVQFLDIMKVKGVENSVLIKKENHKVMFHNFEDPEAIIETVLKIGSNCAEMTSNTGIDAFRYFYARDVSGRNLIIFSVGSYYLGIRASAKSDINQTIQDVFRFLRQFSSGRKNAA